MDYLLQSPGQLAHHLQALRHARGLSQSELGALLGVGQARVARIERDPSVVAAGQLLSMLGALGVQVVLRSADPEPAAPTARGTAAPTSDDAW